MQLEVAKDIKRRIKLTDKDLIGSMWVCNEDAIQYLYEHVREPLENKLNKAMGWTNGQH